VFSKSDEFVFVPLPFVGRNDRLSLQGGGRTPHAQASIDQRQGRLGTFSRFDVTLETRRESFYYVWSLVFAHLIMLMAYVCISSRQRCGAAGWGERRPC
jgi:hypothetical protein